MRTSKVGRVGAAALAWMACATALAADPCLDSAMDRQGWRASPPRTAVPAQGAKLVPEAAANAWQSLGPFGGDVSALAASPQIPGLVLAGTKPPIGSGSLYRSIDGGQTWALVPGHSDALVYDIEFADDGGIFIGTSTGILYGSGDATAFSPRDLRIGVNQVVVDVHLVGGKSSRVWVAVANPFGQQPVALLRSDDGGFMWSNVTPPLATGLGGSAVAVDPANSDHVLAAFTADFGGGAVYASSDGGQSWTNRSAGLPPGRPVFSIVHDGSRFLAGGGRIFDGQFVGLYATTSLGAQWTALHNSGWPLLAVNEIAVDPNQPGVIIAASGGAGVFRSADGGQSWHYGVGGTAGMNVYSARFLPDSSSEVLIGVEAEGVFRSSNGAATFVPSSDGILERITTAVSANPNDPRELAIAFAGENSGGVLRSLDGGQRWQAQAVPGTRYSAIAHAADGTLYAISDGPSTIAPEGLYRREADGSWVSLGPDQGPLFESELEVIAFDPQQPQTVVLGGADFGSGNEGTIWRSSDGGANWSKRYEGPVSGDRIIDLQFADGGVVLATYNGFDAAQAGGVLRSTNGGLDWAPANQGLPAYAREPRLCRSANGQLWLAAWSQFALSALYRSDNDGTNWLTMVPLGGDVTDIACDPDDAHSVYFVRRQGPQVIRTRDSGVSFAFWNTRLESYGVNLNLVPAHGRLLLAGSRGVFRSPLVGQVYADGFETP